MNWAGMNTVKGSGCGSVGIVVASKARGPRFESTNQQILYLPTVKCIEKTKK